MGLKLIPDNTKFQFVNKKAACLLVSLVVILGTISTLYFKGLNFGIDFTGGIVIELESDQKINLTQLRKELGDEISLQNLGSDKAVLIRAPLDKTQEAENQASELKAKISTVIAGKIEYRKTDFVGPQVGSELIKTAITALVLSFAAMFIYMWFRFEWQYGVGALLALVHDAIATVGFYAVSGLEFNITSVAAILTIVGYSINDSVVIYDRLRENIRKHRKKSLPEIIDLSVNETLSRTILTVGTTLLSVIALALFGGEVLKSFSLGMLVGVVVGTYSSIYISAILLIYLDPRRPEGKETENAL